ncbi:MAG TPA: hypothetical protein VET48_14285, partial [Steroidobacteraceae bacterium]|nr:hypothetical protein [Steroidobacteraceae bacterium]
MTRAWNASLCVMFIAAFGCTKQQPLIDPRVDALPIPTATDLAKVAALPSPYNQGDAIKGRLAFGDCAECHSLTANRTQEKGPALNEVFGRRAASGKNFAYSEALRNF